MGISHHLKFGIMNHTTKSMGGVDIHMVMENCHRILKSRAYLKRIYYPSVGVKADGTKTTLEILSMEDICLKDGMQKKMQGLHLE